MTFSSAQSKAAIAASSAQDPAIQALAGALVELIKATNAAFREVKDDLKKIERVVQQVQHQTR